MRKVFLMLILGAGIWQSCSTLHSTTYIDPKKSFVIGEGKHGSYVAQVQNEGKGDIEVIQVNEQGVSTTLGLLKKGDKKEYSVKRNTTVMFKNDNLAKGVIKIRLRGDSNLSMGYKENQQ